MKIEKLNDNKIKIILNNEDLEENKISIHSFMSNSIENQKIFLNILETAKKEVGFSTDNYKVAIETLTQNKDIFTLIISRFNDSTKKVEKKRLHVSRKLSSFKNTFSLYNFGNIENFLDFSNYLSKNFPEISNILNGNNTLYKFNNNYFLTVNKLSIDKKILFKITCIFSEFSEFISISDITLLKLKESGNLLRTKGVNF